MTRLEPSLALRRLVVTKDGRAVYDQSFHEGVNIIRGENGSGKSTVADFIFFALGGDIAAWRKEAALCDFTYAEVAINGEPLLLRREVSDRQQRPMSIYWGEIEDSEVSGLEGWEIYPFAGSSNKESFSQVLFRALGIPEALKEDLGSRVTMHQVLRVLYVDQRTPYDEIFRSDDFDNVVTRDAVGDLLLGVYDIELYRLRLRLRDLERSLSEVNADLKGIGAVLKDEDDVLTVGMIVEKMENVQQDRSSHRVELEALESGESEVSEEDTRGREVELQTTLRRQNQKVKQLEDRLETLDFETRDSDEFTAAMRLRLDALNESEDTQRILGGVEFKFCPACYKPLSDNGAKACPVCKEESDHKALPNLLRMRHELTTQIVESESLQAARQEERERLTTQLPDELASRRRSQEEYDRLVTSAVSSAEAHRSSIHRRLGYLERQLEDLAHQLRLARSVEKLEQRKAELIADRERTTAQMEARSARVHQRKQQAVEQVSESTTELLHNDIIREHSFHAAERVTFDFGRNEVAVDDRANFAASSMVYLKNAFHLSLLLTSLELEFLRYPRFVLFDNIEDKGMEPVRSHNFQQLTVDYSDNSDVAHQIILTTSMINPDLEIAELVIGPRYTHENRSLDISAR